MGASLVFLSKNEWPYRRITSFICQKTNDLIYALFVLFLKTNALIDVLFSIITFHRHNK